MFVCVGVRMSRPEQEKKTRKEKEIETKEIEGISDCEM